MTETPHPPMTALAWTGRVLAALIGLLLFAVVVPALHITCGAGESCGGWISKRSLYLLFYALLIAAPVAMVFVGRGSKRWVGAMGWALLLLLAGVVLL